MSCSILFGIELLNVRGWARTTSAFRTVQKHPEVLHAVSKVGISEMRRYLWVRELVGLGT